MPLGHVRLLSSAYHTMYIAIRLSI